MEVTGRSDGFLEPGFNLVGTIEIANAVPYLFYGCTVYKLSLLHMTWL